jgi:hypothetical protein
MQHNLDNFLLYILVTMCRFIELMPTKNIIMVFAIAKQQQNLSFSEPNTLLYTVILYNSEICAYPHSRGEESKEDLDAKR